MKKVLIGLLMSQSLVALASPNLQPGITVVAFETGASFKTPYTGREAQIISGNRHYIRASSIPQDRDFINRALAEDAELKTITDNIKVSVKSPKVSSLTRKIFNLVGELSSGIQVIIAQDDHNHSYHVCTEVVANGKKPADLIKQNYRGYWSFEWEDGGSWAAEEGLAYADAYACNTYNSGELPTNKDLQNLIPKQLQVLVDEMPEIDPDLN